jgi:TonB family protein
VSSREEELTRLTTNDPSKLERWIELAKLQEDRGAGELAEQTLTKALAAIGRERGVLQAIADFYNRRGDFEKCIAALEEIAAKHPNDAQAQHLVAVYYYDKASKDERLTPDDRERYADLGIAATHRALAVKEDYFEALAYKNLLLRVKANLEGNLAARAALIAEADAVRARSIELSKLQRPTTTPADPTAPAPPPPPAPPTLVDGMEPVRVGGNIKAPVKVYDQRPTYPEEALRARVTGMVILEALIDTRGVVRSAKVLRSIPLLDAAAVEAVSGWRYEPPTRDGVPVPVLMTVTVNFTIQ